MAVTNDAVSLQSALLLTSAIEPPIGASGSQATLGYESGDEAIDTFKNLNTSGVALNSALTLTTGEFGFLRVTNGNNVDVELLIDGSPDVSLGKIPAQQTGGQPFSVTLPIGNGVVILGKADGVNVGVTVIKAVSNTPAE
jgi:hypothetical protein